MRLSRGRPLGKLERRPTRVVDTLALGGGGPNLTFRLSNSHLPLDMRTWGRRGGSGLQLQDPSLSSTCRERDRGGRGLPLQLQKSSHIRSTTTEFLLHEESIFAR